ncbi:MAG: glycosyltransferase [Chloroflexi bacterium]|nr:glycosyltransferase [Chloroflexota bacterium]
MFGRGGGAKHFSSLIITVKNEADALPRLLASIAAQTRAPDEIVIVDGGSTDATLEILRAAATRLPITLIVEPGANISRGRNLAIRAARGEIICSTDAGVRLDAGWVEELVAPFEKNLDADVRGQTQIDQRTQPRKRSNPQSEIRNLKSEIAVVSGFFLPDPRGVFETALAATTLPARADIVPEKFMPSSRSIAFRASAWAQVNGYPEWLDFCEDLVFDFALRDAGLRFAFAPRAVAHFRPRSSLRAFCKQYFQYARGDGKANLFFKRHLIRYATYLIGIPLTLAIFISGIWILGFGISFLGFLGMFFTPYKRLAPMLGKFSGAEKIRALGWVPLIRVAGDVAKMLGYPVGVTWRARNRR